MKRGIHQSLTVWKAEKRIEISAKESNNTGRIVKSITGQMKLRRSIYPSNGLFLTLIRSLAVVTTDVSSRHHFYGTLWQCLLQICQICLYLYGFLQADLSWSCLHPEPVRHRPASSWKPCNSAQLALLKSFQEQACIWQAPNVHQSCANTYATKNPHQHSITQQLPPTDYQKAGNKIQGIIPSWWRPSTQSWFEGCC